MAKTDEQRTMSASIFREFVKQAFIAGFYAAQGLRVDVAWEDCQLRKELDYHDLFNRIEGSQPVSVGCKEIA